ncbi:MAG TPA: signal peptidase I [Tissierellaceae bacterium]|nr:signal peptidase I [Tissierellaceae bacterium]
MGLERNHHPMNKNQKVKSTAEVIKRRRKSLYLKKGYINLLIRIVILVFVGYIFFSQIFLVTRAKGNYMFPAIKDGDLVIAFRLHRDYVKDDIAVYQVQGKDYMGRVVGRETDVVNLDDSGDFTLNGGIQRGEIIYPTYAKEGTQYPLIIEENHIFVLGDHRTQTEDSRDFGSIEKKNVKAKVITILRRRGL